MASSEYLKDSYKWHLRAALIVNAVAFWTIVAGPGNLSSFWCLLNSISLKDTAIALVVPIISFILDGLLSSDAKARIIYPEHRRPLPGSRAFSFHLAKEPRANAKRLERMWGPFPVDPDEQNQLWLQMLEDVGEDVRVREAHRAWLFARDLSAQAVLFLVIFGSGTLIIGIPLSAGAWYLGVLLVVSMASIVAARNRGIRFVRTVLAVAPHRPE